MSEASAIKVSVIVPVYNAELTLGPTLDDILSQTLREIEIICVDDGSADGSAALLDAFSKKDPRIRVVRQENQGAGIARNTGMDQARGEYFCFLDADDRFEPNLLASAYALCEETGADICAWAADSFDARTGDRESYNAAFMRKFVPEANPFSPAEEGRDTVMQMFNGVPWSKMFRASFIRETGLRFQALRTTNDAFFVYCAMCEAKKIATLDKILVHRRKNDGISLTQTRELSWCCFYEALTAIRQELEQKGLWNTFERTYVNRALKNVVWNMDTTTPECALQIATLMKQEGLSRLGIQGRDDEYFFDEKLVERLSWLKALDPEGYVLVSRVGRERDALKDETRKLKNRIKKLEEEKKQPRQEKKGCRLKKKLLSARKR